MHTEGQAGYEFPKGQGEVSTEDWAWLLHPAGAYAHPSDVLDDLDLTRSEKRAVLAFWASDASAVVSQPSLRKLPRAGGTVTIDEIMDALRSLDAPQEGGARSRRAASTTSPWRWRREYEISHSRKGRGGVR